MLKPVITIWLLAENLFSPRITEEFHHHFQCQLRQDHRSVTMTKTLLILIGPKGVGKTYIGSLVDQHTEIAFLRVEPIWIRYYNSDRTGNPGWELVAEAIEQLFVEHDHVMIESLGVGETFDKLIEQMDGKCTIRLIRVKTALETCLERVRNRDASQHIPVSDDKVEQYNQIAEKVVHEWDLVIDNNGPASDDDILKSIQQLSHT